MSNSNHLQLHSLSDQVISVIGLNTKEGTRWPKKLIDNGLFESSRLILPEHKVAWLTQQEQILEKKIPVLDDQELEQIPRTLIDSYNRRLRIHITVFDPITDKVYEGVVSTINTYLREIKLV